jgi:outer membrane protein assembly factor BamB
VCQIPFRAAVPALLLALAAPLAAAQAADWPGWRGPHRDGKSAETGLLPAWKDGGPPLAWRASGLGGGFSSLSVVGERIYTMGDLDGKQHVLALDRKNGKVLWKTAVGPAWVDEYGGPRATPAVDGDRIYAMSTEGELVCLKAADGGKVWSRNLPRDFGGRMMTIWRFAESPLVDGDRVVVTPGVRDAALVALDKRTGEEIWRAKIPALGEKGKDGAGYSSVVVSNGAGVKQYVQIFGRGAVGVEAATGRYLWGYNRIANDVANIPTPLVDGDHVFVSTGYGTGAALLKLVKSGSGVEAREVYFLPGDTFQNHHGNMVLHGGHVYAGSGHNKGFPISVKLADGAIAWGPVRNDGQGSAAVTFADGRLYMRYQNGLMVLVEATPEDYRELGSFEIPEVSHPSWSHPVIAGGKLYLREQDHLFVYDVAAPAKAAVADHPSTVRSRPSRLAR